VEPYGDAHTALYDLFYADYDEDLEMYENFARRSETPSLELGTGTGRVALHLARAGLHVVGIDSAPAMLARLRAKLDDDALMASRVRVCDGDMRSFELGERFDLIFCAANTFQHLTTTADQVAAFRCCARHLTAGGVFVAKIQSPRGVDWSAEDAPLRNQGTRIDPKTGETLIRFASRQPEATTLTTVETRIYDRIGKDGTVRRQITEFAMKYMTPDELALVLQRARMRLLHLYGDHDLSPFDAASDSMVFVAGLEE
jgi:SAM-dependent methyltransferase